MLIYIKEIFFVCLVFLVSVYAEYDSCPTSNSESHAVKLRDSLLCIYDPSVGPVGYEETTNVTFNFIVKYFTYDVFTSILGFDAWLAIGWKDKHLTWTPSDHNNIKKVHLHSAEIWTPDISIYNNANQGDDPLAVGYTKCVVSYLGTVQCVPPIHYDALCTPNVIRFPFDTHNCSLRFGSWMHKGEEINITAGNQVLITKDLTSNGEWKIDSYKIVRHPGKFKCCPNETYPSIEINLMISRLAVAHAASFVIPTLVCVMLTILLLCLSPLNPERMTLCYVNMLVQFLQIQYVSFNVPLKGEGVPLIVLFGRDSLMMGIFALICTIIFKNIMEKKTTPPSMISSLVSLLPNCTFNCSNLPPKGDAFARENDDQQNIIDSETKVIQLNDWYLFGVFLDRLLLIGFIIGYAIMFLTFLP